ncbi:hypothetical protein ACOMHN_058873 [Nucella lapillus]
MSNTKSYKRRLPAVYCRHHYSFRRKMVCLLLITVGMMLVHLATQTLPLIHPLTQHAPKRTSSSSLEYPMGRSPEIQPPIPPHRSSETQTSQVQVTPPDTDQTQTFPHRVRGSMDVDKSAGVLLPGNNHSRDRKSNSAGVLPSGNNHSRDTEPNSDGALLSGNNHSRDRESNSPGVLPPGNNHSRDTESNSDGALLSGNNHSRDRESNSDGALPSGNNHSRDRESNSDGALPSGNNHSRDRESNSAGVLPPGSNHSGDTELLLKTIPTQRAKDPALVNQNGSSGKGNITQPQSRSQTTRKDTTEAAEEETENKVTEPEDPQGWTRKNKENAKELQREKQALMKEVMMIREHQSVHKTKNSSGEIHHVFFLKVHKAASTTVMNMLYRLAISRNLNVMLPSHGNVFSENSKRWTRAAVPRPFDAKHFDILCNHVVFSEHAVRFSLGKGAKFIGIVREPFQQFISAFFYYRNVYRVRYLSAIPGDDPVATYLQNPRVFESKARTSSFTRSRMSFDFGMSPFMMMDEYSIGRYIHYLNRTFDLVMISERFDESMVLMKRLLGWQLQDVLYIKNNVFTKRYHNYTAEQKLAHRSINPADYRLYGHFADLFQKRVEREGKRFKEEVATFVSLREKMEEFCQKVQVNSVVLSATDWTPAFQVSRLDCRFMTLPEVPFVDVMRAREFSDKLMQVPDIFHH